MQKGAMVRLQLPYTKKPGRYFSLRLKAKTVNEKAQYLAPSKLFLLSDIEGNFLSFQKLLIKNGVTDRKHKWTFDDGHLVIVGDCFDRGKEVLECLWLIYSLEEMARRAGGYVHFILGNHEIMNLNSDWRYVHPKYAKPTNENNKITALYDGNNSLWKWLLTKNIIEKIGDILVVHGGVSPEVTNYSYTVNEVNNLIRPYYTSNKHQFEDPFLRLVFNSQQSPFWYRGYYQGSVSEEQIDEILNHFGVNTIITGHTIVENVRTFFNGKVINLNTDHAAGRSEALLIKDNVFYRVDSLGNRTRIM